MLVVGLTGGIASGKSTAAAALAAAGAPVASSDVLAREVVQPGEPALAAIVAAFGAGFVLPDGRLDRRALGRLVFADSGARRQLEAITHPLIHQRMLAWLEARRAAGAPAAVCDIPLLFEAGYARQPSFLDRIWVVRVGRATQLARLMARDGCTLREAEQRLAAQLPLEDKARQADLVLDNEGPPAALEAAAQVAWRAILDRAGGAQGDGL